jgi:hypothetical protein
MPHKSEPNNPSMYEENGVWTTFKLTTDNTFNSLTVFEVSQSDSVVRSQVCLRYLSLYC